MELNEKWKLTTQNNAYLWEGNQISKQNRYPCYTVLTVQYCTVLTSRGLRSSSRPALASPRPTRRQSSTARGQLQG